jgi:aspartyl protease family protein
VNNWIRLSALAVMFLSVYAHAETRVNIVGLFNGKAVVMINGGAPQTLSVGQTKQEVKLLSADSEKATLLIEGKTKVLGMGQAASIAGGGGQETKDAQLKLFADKSGHFFGDVSVNGTLLKYVIDTGATTVAMNSADAKHARIDYSKGVKGTASTASGLVDTYHVKVNTLKLGAITLNDVDVAVIEGGFPEVVLMGMSVLNRLDMQRDSSVMTLKKKY